MSVHFVYSTRFDLPLIFHSGTKIAMSKDEETTPTVNITIFNASQFPMKLLPVEIDFVPVQSDCDSPVHCDSTSSIRIQKNVSTPAPSVFSENSELLPGEKHVELITAKPSCLRQYNGIITASILSPGTGQKLQVQHKFGLYLVDQVCSYKFNGGPRLGVHNNLGIAAQENNIFSK